MSLNIEHSRPTYVNPPGTNDVDSWDNIQDGEDLQSGNGVDNRADIRSENGSGPNPEQIVADLNDGRRSGADLIAGSTVKNTQDSIFSDAELILSKGDLGLSDEELAFLDNETTVMQALKSDAKGARTSGQAFGRWLGRAFMGLAHAVKSIVTFDVFTPSWHRNNVKNYSKKAEAVKENLNDLPPLKGKNATPVAFNALFVATGSGFTVKHPEKVTVEPFPDYKGKGNGSKLYPNGTGKPLLRDIVQDPALQDCWFLASIAAILSTKGPDAISRLITWKEGEAECTVRLGEKAFKVPLAEVKCNGSSCVSKSAPWVKVLEQAAMMYLASNEVPSIAQKRDISVALGMLMVETKEEPLFGTSSSKVTQAFNANEPPATLTTVVNALKKKVPVVLGHVNSMLGSKKNILVGALRDNISPDHAIAVLDIQVRKRDKAGNPTKAWLTVMDPYGHTRIISSSALKRCIGYYGITQNGLSDLKRPKTDTSEIERMQQRIADMSQEFANI